MPKNQTVESQLSDRVMPPSIQAQLMRLLQYNWDDEVDDFIHNCSWIEEDPQGNRREGHIFTTLVRLQAWLDGHSLEDPATLRAWLEPYFKHEEKEGDVDG